MKSRFALLLAASAATSLPLAAQTAGAGAAAAPATCDIELMSPNPLGIAYLQRQRVIQATKPEDAQKAIRDALKPLTSPQANANALGRDYMMAQFFLMAAQYGEVQTRQQLGMTGGTPTATIDLVVAVDSLLQIVEKAKPGPCAAEAQQWREFKIYPEIIQQAYKLLAANSLDSAATLAKRAQVLNKSGAQSYDLLWRVAKEKKDEPGMVSNLQMAADKLIGDTLNSNVRANFLFTLGRIQQELGDKRADKAEKARVLREAVKAYMQVLKEYPSAQEAPFALSGISSASYATSDTAMGVAAVELIKSQIDKYEDITLAQTGVVATRAGRTADAVALFEAATRRNPYSRDYQYNLAAMMHEAKRPADMMPVIKKLLELDPSNGDNVMLLAFAYKGLSDVEKDPARKKALIDSVNYYGKIADEMPHKVVYAEFDRSKDKTTLIGQVENTGKAAKAYTIEFEFLGKDGAVVGKQTANIASVAPGATGEFRVELPIGGVLGVRYAPLPKS